MYSTILFSLLVACFSLSEGKPWASCGKGKLAKLVNVDVQGCTANPCILKRGTSVGINVTFTPEEGVTKISNVVHGIIAGLPIKFPLPNPDGCKKSGLTCPLKKNLQVKYQSVIKVLKDYPHLRLVVKWQMLDQKKQELWCAVIPAEID